MESGNVTCLTPKCMLLTSAVLPQWGCSPKYFLEWDKELQPVYISKTRALIKMLHFNVTSPEYMAKKTSYSSRTWITSENRHSILLHGKSLLKSSNHVLSFQFWKHFYIIG